MGFNLFFDVAALSILAFLVFSIILKKQIVGTSNIFYLAVIICSSIATILDILASLEFFSINLLFTLNTFFVLFRASITLALFLYTCNLGKVYHRLKRNNWIYASFFIPIFVLTVTLIINFFNKGIFDYLDGPTYQRGPYMWVAYLIGGSYVLASIIVAINSYKYYLKPQVIAIIAAFLVQIGASIFQFFVGNVLIEMFVTALTLLTLSLFIESPENFVDFKTNALNYHSFTSDVQQELDIKVSFDVLFIKVTNTSTFYNLFPYKQAVSFNRACNAHVSEKVKKIDKTSLVYFLGNATFAYVLNNRNVTQNVVDLVQEEFAHPMVHNGISFQFVAKTCLINCPEDCNNVADLIAFSNTFFDLTEDKHLDIKPYRQEKGNVLFNLDHILERAIANKSFSLYYQGIYSLEKKTFVSAEALLRLNDPDYGLIMPNLMIPYAERRGKINSIGPIIFEKAFSFFASNLRGKIDYIEINLSPNQLLDSNLVKDIEWFAKQYNIKPEEVIFEILESTAVMEEPTIENNIKQLKEFGYQFAIDDFGTGYSNLSRILQLDISILKFDRTMSLLLENGQQDDFFYGLLPFFKNQNITLLFEGVETKEVAEKLASMKVDQIQGFYYCKPNPEGEFLKLLERNTK